MIIFNLRCGDNKYWSEKENNCGKNFCLYTYNYYLKAIRNKVMVESKRDY